MSMNLGGMIESALRNNPKNAMAGLGIAAAGFYALKKSGSGGTQKMMAEMDQFMASQMIKKGMSTGAKFGIAGAVFATLATIGTSIWGAVVHNSLKSGSKSFKNMLKAMWHSTFFGDEKELNKLVTKKSASAGGKGAGKNGTAAAGTKMAEYETEMKKLTDESSKKTKELSDLQSEETKLNTKKAEFDKEARKAINNIETVRYTLRKYNEARTESGTKALLANEKEQGFWSGVKARAKGHWHSAATNRSDASKMSRNEASYLSTLCDYDSSFKDTAFLSKYQLNPSAYDDSVIMNQLKVNHGDVDREIEALKPKLKVAQTAKDDADKAVSDHLPNKKIAEAEDKAAKEIAEAEKKAKEAEEKAQEAEKKAANLEAQAGAK